MAWRRLVLSVASMLLLALCLGFLVNAQGVGRENVYENFELFGRAFQNVRNYYYDTEKINPRDLIYGAVKGMLEALEDEHTSFLPPADVKSLSESTSGEYGGLGIVIGLRDRALTVISPIYGTPAWEKHIQPGDKITYIDGETTKDILLDDALRKLRGPVGSTVTITIARSNQEEVFDISIKRALIRIETVKTAFLEDEGIAYIKITQFSENTAELLKDAYASVKDKPNLKSLIVDLRNNPGGLLGSATDIANLFIPEGLLVYTKGREAESTRAYMASRSRFLIPENLPIAVLVNKGSASASEILAGALQDTKRATIMGETTFGKASVQSIRPLSDGSAIKLTVALYYTPAGRQIHTEGLTPDIAVEVPEYSAAEQKAVNRLLNDDYLANFIKEHPEYNDRQVREFADALRDKDIVLPPEELERWLYWEKNKIGEPELVNLRFDVQLRKAVECLTNGRIKTEKELKVFSNVP